MTPMRYSLIVYPCLLLTAALSGCSTTGGPRFGARPAPGASTAGTKSMAVVGDRTMPTVSGDPGSQVAAEVPDPEPRRNPKARISGRVVDDQGRPVSGATVRLADGGTKGGRDVRATTDKAGGFTLNGLRPGSSYSLIAELDDDQSPMTGRVVAQTAETGVEISLASAEDSNSSKSRSSRTSRARPISSREETTGPGPRPDSVNSEDLPPAREADEPALEPEPPADRQARSNRPRLSAPVPTAGWKKGGTASSPRSTETSSDEDPSTEADQPRTRSRSARPVDLPLEEEAGGNPLPPAIDRSPAADPDDQEPATSSRPRRKVSVREPAKASEPGDLELASASAESRIPATSGGPPTMPALGDPAGTPDGLPPQVAQAPSAPIGEIPPDSLLGTLASEAGKNDLPTSSPPDSPGPTTSPPPPNGGTPSLLTLNPAPEPVFASTPPPREVRPTSKPAEPPAPTPSADYNPFVLASTNTVSEPAQVAPPPVVRPFAMTPAEPEVATVPPSTLPPRKKWSDIAANEPAPVVIEPTKATPSLVKRLRGSNGPEGRDPAVALCSYDARLRRIVDFRLPDLDGKLVRFQDLDADYVLLDFWGSWCAPCFEAIPHLIELQKQYGPKKLKVVGIACEKVPVEARKDKVEQASRKLGINYPVLMSGMDGKPCPVQESLQIQTYPTTILVDRQGRILWRNSGATPANQIRLDRVLAALGNKGETVRR